IDTSLGRKRATCSARRSSERPAARATTRKRSGNASTTSSDERPIEPVDPRIDRDLILERDYRGREKDDRAGSVGSEPDQERGHHRAGEQERVDAVVEPPVARQEPAPIFDPGPP